MDSKAAESFPWAYPSNSAELDKARSRLSSAYVTFEPQLIPKHQTRWTGFDDKILSLYSRGMTVREIQSHLEEMYGTEVSPTLITIQFEDRMTQR